MVIETLVTKGVGWQDAGKWFWDVYVADVQGQPSLYYGEAGSEQEAHCRAAQFYREALQEYNMFD